jgi:hypothetical protein
LLIAVLILLKYGLNLLNILLILLNVPPFLLKVLLIFLNGGLFLLERPPLSSICHSARQESAAANGA